jgi:hypothetical protein
MRFKTSVWVRTGDLNVVAVDTVDYARAILSRWPYNARVGLFLEVRAVLEKAAMGRASPEDARACFVSLLETVDMLGESTPA